MSKDDATVPGWAIALVWFVERLDPLNAVLHENGIGCSKFHHVAEDHNWASRVIRAALADPEPPAGLDVERLTKELNRRVKSYRSFDDSFGVIRERDEQEARDIIRSLAGAESE